MVNIPIFTGFHTCQVVQDFFQQQQEGTKTQEMCPSIPINNYALKLKPFLLGNYLIPRSVSSLGVVKIRTRLPPSRTMHWSGGTWRMGSQDLDTYLGSPPFISHKVRLIRKRAHSPRNWGLTITIVANYLLTGMILQVLLKSPCFCVDPFHQKSPLLNSPFNRAGQSLETSPFSHLINFRRLKNDFPCCFPFRNSSKNPYFQHFMRATPPPPWLNSRPSKRSHCFARRSSIPARPNINLNRSDRPFGPRGRFGKVEVEVVDMLVLYNMDW